jgi:hypothetical protein
MSVFRSRLSIVKLFGSPLSQVNASGLLALARSSDVLGDFKPATWQATSATSIATKSSAGRRFNSLFTVKTPVPDHAQF